MPETIKLEENTGSKLFFFCPLPKTCLLILERGIEREKEREGNINVREKHQMVAFHKHPNQ